MKLLRERSKGIGLERLGEQLAKAVGRPRPFGSSSVHRFLDGTQVTDVLVDAFSRLFELPYPVVSASSPDEVLWFELGRRIKEIDQAMFAELLAEWSQWATLETEKRKLAPRFKPPKK